MLGQTVDLIGALAERVDELAIVARDVEWDGVPANASRADLRRPGERSARGWAFERALTASLVGADGVLVHMVPQFAVLAAPAARVRRVPFALWYTHWHAGPVLRVATRMVDVVFSVDTVQLSCRFSEGARDRPCDRCRAFYVQSILQGERDRCACSRSDARPAGKGSRPCSTLSCSRSVAARSVQLEIRGPSLTDDERAHRAELERRVAADDGSVRACRSCRRWNVLQSRR